MVDKFNLIVIDDEPALEKLYSIFLHDEIENKILNFIFFKSPLEAIEKLKQVDPHGRIVIVSDHFMPDMDGGVFGKIIKRDFPEALFFLSSGLTREELSLRVDVDCIDGFFLKPMDMESVKNHVLGQLSLKVAI